MGFVEEKAVAEEREVKCVRQRRWARQEEDRQQGRVAR